MVPKRTIQASPGTRETAIERLRAPYAYMAVDKRKLHIRGGVGCVLTPRTLWYRDWVPLLGYTAVFLGGLSSTCVPSILQVE